MNSDLSTTSFCVEADAEYPFSITAKRYAFVELRGIRSTSKNPLTLIFLHSTGFLKEIWEPTLQDLFALFLENGLVDVEAWTVECPNHGASAILNQKALRHLPREVGELSCERYAAAAHRFLVRSRETTNVDFTQRNLVGIGHSLGAAAMAMLQRLQPALAFSTVILIEPLLSPYGPEHLQRLRENLIRGACERRDVWPSRQSAREHLGPKVGLWDSRVLDVYIEYGLRAHPAVQSCKAPFASECVTLCCSREQETIMYNDVDGPTKPIADLDIACGRIPVHVIFGAVNDSVPRAVQEALVDPSSPRRFASITRLANAGHLVPQQVPTTLASTIAHILGAAKPLILSKL